MADHDSLCLITKLTRADGTVMYVGTCSCEYAQKVREDEQARIRGGVKALFAEHDWPSSVADVDLILAVIDGAPDGSAQTCALCGHQAPILGGHADSVDLCHGCTAGHDCQPESCYVSWTVHGARPPDLTPEEYDQLHADIYDDRLEHMDRDEGRR